MPTSLQGEFYNRNNPQEAPFSPPALPGVQATDRMMYLWLSDYMADTAGYVYQKAGLMQYELTPENTHVSQVGLHSMNLQLMSFL